MAGNVRIDSDIGKVLKENTSWRKSGLKLLIAGQRAQEIQTPGLACESFQILFQCYFLKYKSTIL